MFAILEMYNSFAKVKQNRVCLSTLLLMHAFNFTKMSAISFRRTFILIVFVHDNLFVALVAHGIGAYCQFGMAMQLNTLLFHS
jgi:hypothetical protein